MSNKAKQDMIVKAFLRAFPGAIVDIRSLAYYDGLIVSTVRVKNSIIFSKMNDTQRQQRVWEILASMMSEDDLMAYGPINIIPKNQP